MHPSKETMMPGLGWATTWLGLRSLLLAAVLAAGLAACAGANPVATPVPPPEAEELVLYDWAGDLIEELFDGFFEEFGVRVRYLVYESPEEAVANIRAGESYDIVVLENQYVAALVAEGLLAEIDYRHLPNFRNISANFRDLVYDPDNAHSIPYSWGTTGLVVRSDLTGAPVARWADMWDLRYQGRVVAWEIPRYTIGSALKSLGYSVNSENRAELEEALARLLELRSRAIWLVDEESSAPLLTGAQAVMALGWAYDVQVARQTSENIDYVLPEEGAILWGDNFVIPANSPNKATAELFLNYILRPEITGQLVNLNYYAMANDAADAYIDPAIRNDPVIYPPNQDLRNAEILLQLSPEGERLHAEIWERFMSGGP